jgi:putative GTP pyrophosphokinase
MYFLGGMTKFSKNQIDKLGDRLRSGVFTQEDLRMLDEYRRSYESAYQSVVTSIREAFKLDPTGRAEKSTPSIIDKLRRSETQSSRLSQMQDVAGCRIIVEDIQKQDEALKVLEQIFKDNTTIDRRLNPSHGYRAIHVIVEMDGLSIEIQIRTRLQHAWAVTSEKIADLVDHRLKYGIGPEVFRKYLGDISRMIHNIEIEEDFRDSIRIMEKQQVYLPSDSLLASAHGLAEELRLWSQVNEKDVAV